MDNIESKERGYNVCIMDGGRLGHGGQWPLLIFLIKNISIYIATHFSNFIL